MTKAWTEKCVSCPPGATSTNVYILLVGISFRDGKVMCLIQRRLGKVAFISDDHKLDKHEKFHCKDPG